MKLKAVLAIGMLSLANYAQAATYTFNNVALGVGDTLYADSVNALSSGTILHVGYFPTTFAVSGVNLNKTDLLSNFTSLSSVSTGTTTPSLDPGVHPGYTEYAPIAGAVITGSNVLIGRTLYAFAGNNGTLASSSDFSLFQVAIIADDVPVDQEYVVNPAGITPVLGTSGTFIGDAGGGIGTYNTLKTAFIPVVAVPEPSAALLGAIGALGLLRRRRN